MAIVNVDTISRPALNIVIVGHVDHGKSTLIGRLLHDTGSLPEGKYESVARVCEDAGKEFEFAFLLDALQEERDQGVTIDTAQIHFRTEYRDYVIIDAPGHKEFLKNMITGAAYAGAAILIIDAEEGIQEQSRRHGYLLHLLGIHQVAVLIGKMDLVGYSQEVFEGIRKRYLAFLAEIDITPEFVIPVSARDGDNVAQSSDRMAWYNGPTLLEALALFSVPSRREDGPLRMPVQDVYKFDRRRIIAGRVESGQISIGDEVLFEPSGHLGIVKTIERWRSPGVHTAVAGESIGITLEEQLFVERGEIIAHPDRRPRTGSILRSNVFWLGDRHLVVGGQYILKLSTQEVECTVSTISGVINTATLERVGDIAREVAKNEVATVDFDLKKALVFDQASEVIETGRFVIVDGFDVCGGGTIPDADLSSSYQL